MVALVTCAEDARDVDTELKVKAKVNGTGSSGFTVSVRVLH